LTSFNRDKFTAVSALSIHPDLGHFSYNFGYQTLSFGFFGFPLAPKAEGPELED